MTLVWHMVRKDLRHIWIYLAVALLLLLISASTLFSALFTVWNARLGFQATQGVFEVIQVLAWVLVCGVLLLSEPLPGLQQYWLTRPIRWQHLLSAKVLLIVLFSALPIAVVHCVIIALRGFPLTDHFAGIAWNALLLAAACFVPVALAASLSRNLQQLILWLLGLGGMFLLLRQWSTDPANSTEWVVNDVSMLIGLVGGAAIITWQYAKRQTKAGRVTVLLLIGIVGTVHRWPASFRYGLQHAASPLRVDDNTSVWRPDAAGAKLHKISPENYWMGSRMLEIPISMERVPEGWTAELDGWNGLTVTADGDIDHGSLYSKGPTISRKEGRTYLYLHISNAFINRHSGRPANISVGTELVLYGPPQTITMDPNSTTVIPGVGRCQSNAATVLTVGCALAINSPWNIRGQWAISELGENAPTVLTVPENRSPIPLLPVLSPLALPYGGFGAASDYTKGRIYLKARKPMAYVHRNIELTGVPLI